MTPPYKPPTIAEVGLRKHVELLGVDYERLVELFETGITSSAVAKIIKRNVKTIRVWRKQYEKEK